MPNPDLVFVVDDDPAMLRALKRLLGQFGYESRLFPSAERLEQHTDFEEAVCIVLDINLKDRCGIELRKSLKAAGISVPVIYITGNDCPTVRQAAVNSGCIAYLKKPFAAMALIEPLQRVSAGLC